MLKKIPKLKFKGFQLMNHLYMFNYKPKTTLDYCFFLFIFITKKKMDSNYRVFTIYVHLINNSAMQMYKGRKKKPIKLQG